MIFYQKSPRYISLLKAREWVPEISGQVKKVGVFVNETAGTIQSVAEELNLDYIQLHGDETPEFCNTMIKPVIKVFSIDNKFDNFVLEEYKVYALLFDTYKKGKIGGTGESFNCFWIALANKSGTLDA